MTKIKAPFTKEQVEALNEYQHNGKFHPFTCMGLGNPFVITEEYVRKNTLPEHLEMTLQLVGRTEYTREGCPNEGLLIPTEEGWICPCGKYKQDWAHEFMTQKL